MTNIYVDQFDSYPDELKECIKKYSTTIKKYINTGIERSDNAIESSLEWTSVFKDLELNKLFMEFWSIASKYLFIGYHVTRICSLAEIQKNGLLILEFENYKNRLSKVLQEHDISQEEIDYAMMRIKKMYAFLHRIHYCIQVILIISQEIMVEKLLREHSKIIRGWKKFGIH